MFVHALSGAASFAAALKLFRTYPLAVSPWSGDGWQRSLVLRYGSGFFVLSQEPAEHFILRPWAVAMRHRRYGRLSRCPPPCTRCSPRACRSRATARCSAGSATGRHASLLSVYHGRPGGAGGGTADQGRCPMVGSEPLQWPPFTAEPLDDGRLWQYLDRGELVDLAPVVAGSPGARSGCRRRTSTAPPRRTAAWSSSGRCPSDEFWLPAGVYMDHWMLREGVPAPPAATCWPCPAPSTSPIGWR